MRIFERTPGFFADLPEHIKKHWPSDVALAQQGCVVPVEFSEKTLWVHDRSDPDYLVRVFVKEGLSHLFGLDSPFLYENLLSAAQSLSRPQDFMVEPQPLLLPGAQEILHVEFKEKAERETFNQQLHLATLPLRPSVNENIYTICAELFMNAVYDAPKESKRIGLSDGTFAGRLEAAISIYKTEDKALIVCSDPFGALIPEKFIGRIGEVYEQGARAAMRMSSGAGAGLGCMMIYERCSSLYLAVSPGQKTQVACLLPLKLSQRRSGSLAKSLHVLRMAG